MRTEYHKIQSIYKRDERGRFIEGEWSRPVIGYLASLDWVWTEKVDGTNIRLIVDDGAFHIGGRTERAQIPAKLVEYIHGSGLDRRLLEYVASQDKAIGPFVLYGEGFGDKIQKAGKNYGPDQRFVLFDVRVGQWWLERDDVEAIARALDIPVVPIVGQGTLYEAMQFIEDGFTSTWGDFTAEGIVCRPVVHLKTRNGDRVIVKVKGKDLTRMRQAA